MVEGTDNSLDSYRDSYLDDATGKTSAFQGMNRPGSDSASNKQNAGQALRASEASASAAGASAGSQTGLGAARSSEGIAGPGAGNGLYTGRGRSMVAAGKGKSKIGVGRAIMLLPLILIIAVGLAIFASASTLPFSFKSQVTGRENKLSAAVYTRTEYEVARRLQSTDPADSLNEYMQGLFADYGFKYIENVNSDGTVARALVYEGNSDSPTLVASTSVKDQILSVLGSTGTVINNYRTVASIPTGQDEIAAAWYGALSVVTAGAWYDDSASLTYNRLGLNPGRFNTGNPNPTDEEVVEAAKRGDVTENVNNTTGVTFRYVWTEHPYQYCIQWGTEIVNGKSVDVCKAYAQSSVWDWDSNSMIGGKYARPRLTSDPFPVKKHTAAETCPPWEPGNCGSFEEQSVAAQPAPFVGDEVYTTITPDDSEDEAREALDRRGILAAFSTSPEETQGSGNKQLRGEDDEDEVQPVARPMQTISGSTTQTPQRPSNSSDSDDDSGSGGGKSSPMGGGPGHVSTIKKDDSLISALTTMIKNKTTNFADNILNSIDKTMAGKGGMEMNYYMNLINTPAKAYDANNKEVSNIAATASVSFNSWFSDDVKVNESSEDWPLVQKYNVAKSLDDKDIKSIAINNAIQGNYNNMDETSLNNKTAENMNNSQATENEDPYHYCEYADGVDLGQAPCPHENETLDPDEYRINDDVATYAYALTSVKLNSDPAGAEAAVALNEGISLFHDAMIKQSSGSYASTESLTAFLEMQHEYGDKLANYERHTRSPFDATSTNTFLGSIVANLLPFATTMRNNALFSTIAATANVITGSISSLLPSAAAYSLEDLNFIHEETTLECIAGETSTMLCDKYGNPIGVMEMDHMRTTSMDAVKQQMINWGYITCDENGCELTDEAKAIDAEYLDGGTNPISAIRDSDIASTPIAADATLASDISNSEPEITLAVSKKKMLQKYSFNKWALCTQNDTGINNNLSKQSGQAKLSTWQAIVNFVKLLFGASPEKKVRIQTACGGNFGEDEEAKKRYQYFAQFTLDQRVEALMKNTEESAVTAHLKQYYAEHPLDQSYEGVIARGAGLTVAEVRDIFADMEYAVYIARYDAGSRYQFVEPEISELDYALEQTDQDVMKIAAIVGKIQDFEELKNRNYAA